MFKHALILGCAVLLSACGGGGGGSGGNQDVAETFTTYTKQIDTWDLPSADAYPKQMALYNNKLYVALTGEVASTPSANDQIASFDVQTHAFATEWAIARPYGVAFESGGVMWVSAHPTTGSANPGIYRATGSLSTQSSAVYAGLVYDSASSRLVWGRTYNSASKVFFGDDSTSLSLAGTPGGLLLQGGQLFVTRSDVFSSAGQTVCGVQRLSNGAFSDFACAKSFNRPQALAYSASTGQYYVINSGIPSDASTWSVYRVAPSGAVEANAFLTSADGLCQPVGAAVVGNFLYVANGPCSTGSKGRILRVNLS